MASGGKVEEGSGRVQVCVCVFWWRGKFASLHSACCRALMGQWPTSVISHYSVAIQGLGPDMHLSSCICKFRRLK